MKDIKGYENLYAVTSCGKVWSHRRKRFLKPQLDKDGYLKIGLVKDGEVKFFHVHRLVALAFVPNPKNLPEVNLIDEVKTHAYVNNLEWCNHKYNMNWATCPQRISEAHRGVSRGGKVVYCPELNETFWGVSEASQKYGLDQGTISKCCLGKRESCGRHPVTGEKLHWQFVS